MTRAGFIAFTFIIIIAVIILADSLGSAVAIISVVTSFFVICSIGSKMGAKCPQINASAAPSLSADVTPAADEKPSVEEPSNDVFAGHTSEESMYGTDYSQMRSYVTSYPISEPSAIPLRSVSECTRDVDTYNAQMAARRARDKRSMDGATVKDADYWRAWHGDELAQAEAAPWWGEY